MKALIRKFAPALLVILPLAVLAFIGEAKGEFVNVASAGYGGKVTICHANGSAKNPYNKITVSENALKAHKKHGDTLPAQDGSCPGPAIP